MIALLLILIPVVGGIAAWILRGETIIKTWSLLVSLASLAVMSVGLLGGLTPAETTFNTAWLGQLGASFSLHMDGISAVLCLLTVLAYPLILLSTWNNTYKNSAAFYALMLLAQAGIMGVFLAYDGLLFYFFWELALIPVYFLSSIWGGERRIAVTFKFFIYTFIGSLLMLAGLIYLYYQTPDQSFAWSSLKAVQPTGIKGALVFWFFFIAFAIKMPIFPFHTWQPDTYEQSPTAVTMVLSALMVKMGLFAVVRWLIPLFPAAAIAYDNIIIGLSVVGMIYASLLALKQDDLKRLIAYASIAHIGLMAAALFLNNEVAMQGAAIQFFSHGVNVLGLWIVVDFIEQKMGTRKMSELGGLATKAPVLSILLVVVSLANVALPLTNAFIGEFLMFNGLYKFNVWYAAVGGLSIILSAIYTLNMIQKLCFGTVSAATQSAVDLPRSAAFSMVVIVVAIFVFGIYPAPFFEMTKDAVAGMITFFTKQ